MDAVVTGGRTLSSREEELLGLLAGFPDGEGGSDRELSFSDLVEAGARPGAPHGVAAAARDDHGSTGSPGKRQDAAAASKQQKAAPPAPEKRPRRQRSGSRGSCGGGGDGVLLNFYVPGLRLTRSMTAPRPWRGATTAPAKAPPAAVAAAAGKARAKAPLGIGCWPALWGRRPTAKVCS